MKFCFNDKSWEKVSSQQRKQSFLCTMWTLLPYMYFCTCISVYELCSCISGLLTFATGGLYTLEVIFNYLISDLISYISMMTATGSQQLCIFLHHIKSFKCEWQMSVLMLKMLRPSSYLPCMKAPQAGMVPMRAEAEAARKLASLLDSYPPQQMQPHPNKRVCRQRRVKSLSHSQPPTLPQHS